MNEFLFYSRQLFNMNYSSKYAIKALKVSSF
jgi:hypothetical protein